MKHLFIPAALALLGACATASPAPPPLENTAWRFERIDGAAPVSNRARLEFLPGRISASAGCNGLGGEWRLEGSRIVTGPFMSTRMYCEGLMDQERAVSALLSASPAWRMAGNRLELQAAGHRAVLMRVSPPPRRP